MSALFSVPNQLEVTYRTLLSKAVRSWLPVRLKDISDEHWLRELADLSTRQSVIRSATSVAVNMITRVNVSNLKDWRSAAFKSQGGPQIYNLLKEELDSRGRGRLNSYIEKTSRYISDIPSDVAKSLLVEIAESQQQGIRPESIGSIIKLRFPTLMNNKIKMLARTGASSASSNLTRIRSEELGIPCFVWDTSEDQRVRPSHRIMDGVVVFWNDLPSPEQLNGGKPVLGKYLPGDCPNCRCFPRPILTLQDIFSAKISSVRVFMNGRIEYMTRAKFAGLSGIEERLAA